MKDMVIRLVSSGSVAASLPGSKKSDEDIDMTQCRPLISISQKGMKEQGQIQRSACLFHFGVSF